MAVHETAGNECLALDTLVVLGFLLPLFVSLRFPY